MDAETAHARRTTPHIRLPVLGLFWLILVSAAATLCAQEPYFVRTSAPEDVFTASAGDAPADAGGQLQGGAGDGLAEANGNAAGANNDLMDMDIGQLGKVDVVVPAFSAEVTSVTRSESTVGKSPAAVFVVTQDMIRRSGATSIPEILRMVPGLQVARIDANKWTVSSRGFNGFVSNKTLVMIDGRRVAEPLFDGVLFGSVNWDAEDLVLQDIERIEVVRGPGGTMWGDNAVNGVINIITKNSADTQGVLYSGGGGSEDKAINAVRYGGSSGDNFHYRVYVKQFERDSGTNPRIEDLRHGNVAHEGAFDDWRQQRIGFRSDWKPYGNNVDTVTFQGDYYDGASGVTTLFTQTQPPHEDYVLNQDTNNNGGNLLWRWNHELDGETGSTLQAYYDHVRRDSETIRIQMDTFNVEWVDRFPLNDWNKLTWGARYRNYFDQMEFPNQEYRYHHSSRSNDLFGVFVQDQIPIVEDVFDVWIGAKAEHNAFTGMEYQSNARFLWTLDPKNVIWGAASRAVRPPSRTEDDLSLLIGIHNHVGVKAFQSFSGNSGVAAENVSAFELGYRSQTTDYFSWDIAGFYNKYTDLIVLTTIDPLILNGGLLQYSRDIFDNAAHGSAYGAEVSSTLSLTDTWRLTGAFSYVRIFLQLEPRAHKDLIYEEGITPQNQIYLQSSWDLPSNIEFDLMTRFVDQLPLAEVRAYWEMNARLAYKPSPNWEFSLVGQNMLNPSHREFEQLLISSNRIDRGIYAQVVWIH